MDRVVNLLATGSQGRALSGSSLQGVQLSQAEGFASFPIGRRLAFSVGARGVWQRVADAKGAAVLGFEWAVFSFFSVGVHSSL